MVVGRSNTRGGAAPKFRVRMAEAKSSMQGARTTQWHAGENRCTRVKGMAMLAMAFGVVTFSVVVLSVFQPQWAPGPWKYLMATPTCGVVRGAWDGRPSNVLLRGGDELTALNFTTSLSVLPQMLELHVKDEILKLLGEFLDMLNKYDVEVIMFYGSLLGSLFFHDMIPWDDDIDVLINMKDINKLRALFRDPVLRETYETRSFHDPYDMYSFEALKFDIPLNNTFSCGPGRPGTCYHKGKIYRKTSTQAGRRPWKYPFIDFIFYKVNDTHFFIDDKMTKPRKVTVPIDDIYPLHLRPFNRFWMKAPRNPFPPMREKYGDFICRQGFWDHQKEGMNFAYYYNYDTQCAQTRNCYPTARRRPITDADSDELSAAIRRKSTTSAISENQGPSLLPPSPGGERGVVEELVFRGTVLRSVVIEDEIYEDPYVLTMLRGKHGSSEAKL